MANCSTYPGYAFCVTGLPKFNAPVMGTVPNCELIGSLSAIAWVTNSITLNSSEVVGGYAIKLFNPEKTYTVSKDLWLDTSINPPGFIYARSSYAGEFWPAIYEKAYAERLKGQSICDMHQIPDIWTANEETVLGHILGKRIDNTLAVSYGEVFPRFIYQAQKKIVRPMVVRTKPNIGVPDKTDQMIHDHTYAVLGVHTAGGQNYLVLRNPLGVTYQSQGPNVITAGVWNGVSSALFNIDNPAKIKAIAGPVINIPFGNGIFAIKDTALADYSTGNLIYAGSRPNL